MKLKYLLILIPFFLFHSCKEENRGINVSLNSGNKNDTIYVSELITENKIIQLNKKKQRQNIHLNNSTVAEIYDKNKDNSYLTILVKNKDLNISIKPNSSITTNDKSDSLLNFLWKSNLSFISQNSSFIFLTKNIDSIPILFEKFRKQRANKITKSKKQITSDIADILYFQNDARIYSFLFYLGRVVKNLDPNNSYFDFIKKIPKANKTLKSLPDIYLYKYEVEYLRKNKSIESITAFLRYIEKKTNNNDLADFLKANYIKALIDMPSYWEKHEKLFNTEILAQTLASEKNNLYYNLIEQPISSFYASQNGEIAYLFQAEDLFGDYFNLENSIGKVVFIDVWATWCGPCINHRPKVLEFVKKYKDNDDIEILLVSVDASKDKWLSFLNKENQTLGKNLFIKKGMRTDFGNNYNIKSIPRYILIGKDGKIINSNINEPSLAVENEIENALKQK
ncbi:TlpA family protein disulfide reductase [Polaribacter sp. MSW13]|uniref:TlpA family protein disulfide reductase n=1 Tax=Polaribacter marinus TaxID=2916838 RepID=A0A9X2AL63_9FLAO|nr:TlpA disulfide reductase family protein [Polaribacter marinus]MCI2230248.1 TlpA family protein disulfide reductase [Polaribacter marinus]